MVTLLRPVVAWGEGQELGGKWQKGTFWGEDKFLYCQGMGNTGGQTVSLHSVHFTIYIITRQRNCLQAAAEANWQALLSSHCSKLWAVGKTITTDL